MRKGRREEFNKEAGKPGEEDMNEKRKKEKTFSERRRGERRQDGCKLKAVTTLLKTVCLLFF